MRSAPRETEHHPVGFIHVGRRWRQPSPQSIAALAESMEKIGLQQPITVRVVDRLDLDDGTIEGALVLVAGATRLAAAKSLGWEKIECLILDGDEADAELWEIAENLHRAELTALERSEQVARYAELVEAKVAQVEPVSGGRGNKGGERETSRQLNLSRGEVQRSKKVAALTPEAKAAAREAGLDDNRTALMEAGRQTTAAAQVAVLHARAEQKQRKPVGPAPDPLNDLEAREKQVTALMGAWNRASAEAREEFMRRIDRPVFDQTRHRA
jgi:ParB-like chromosome segregation protein Spo0J